MKFQNIRRAFVHTGSRESVPPYGVTRDYTADEIAQSVDIRHAIDRGHLIPYDPAYDPQTDVAVNAAENKPKADYILAENEGGQRKTVKPANGRGAAVTYIVADSKGSDGVSNPGERDVIARDKTGKKSLDYIEPAISGRNEKGEMKTVWKTASDAFERQLKSEEASLEYDDSDTLTERDGSDNPDPADADEMIKADLTTVITKNEGNMGARETNTREMISETVTKVLAQVDKATRPDYDDGETFAQKFDGKGAEMADLLTQPFNIKKWFVSKCSDKEILGLIAAHTKSENVKALASQRLTELGA